MTPSQTKQAVEKARHRFLLSTIFEKYGNVIGTHGQGNIDANYKDLVRVFGKPHHAEKEKEIKQMQCGASSFHRVLSSWFVNI